MNFLHERRANGPSEQLSSTGVARAFGPGLAGVALLATLAACQPTEVATAPAPAAPPALAAPAAPPAPARVQVAAAAPAPRCELPDFDGGRKYVVEAWALPDSAFDVGEPLRLQMRSSAPSHMSVFYVSTSCKVTRLLDNHPVQAAEIVDFPLAASGLRMTVKPPTGDEAFHFVATRDRLDMLSPADILGQAAGIANLDLTPAQFHERLVEARSRINPDDWSAVTLRTSVVGH